MSDTGHDYRTLDAITVIACLVALIGGGIALIFVSIPTANLPILASLMSGTFGLTLGLYAGARWGNNNQATKKPDLPAGSAVAIPPEGGSATAASAPAAAETPAP